MRQNPYGSKTMENPNGKFAEAFAFGYAASILDAELDCLTLSAITGPFGLIGQENERTPTGQRQPIFKSVKSL